jgi:hypothetical protein
MGDNNHRFQMERDFINGLVKNSKLKLNINQGHWDLRCELEKRDYVIFCDHVLTLFPNIGNLDNIQENEIKIDSYVCNNLEEVYDFFDKFLINIDIKKIKNFKDFYN